MKIVQASTEQAQAVKSIIVEQMAERLAAESVDLSNDDAVIAALTGFGSASVAELWERARAMARDIRPGRIIEKRRRCSASSSERTEDGASARGRQDQADGDNRTHR